MIRYFHLVLGVLAVLFVAFTSPPASATSYAHYTPIQVTERTDIWITARVLSVTAPVIRENEYGDLSPNVTAILQVLRATDDTPSGLISVNSDTTFYYRIKPGTEVLAAFRKANGGLQSLYQLGLYGWYTVNEGTGMVDTIYGPVAKDKYWRWLVDLRSVIDNKGEVDDEPEAYWSSALRKGNLATVGLAVDYLSLLSEPDIGSSDYFSAFVNVVDKNIATDADFYAIKNKLGNLAKSVAVAVKTGDTNECASSVIRFMTENEIAEKLLNENKIEEALWSVLGQVTQPSVLAKFPNLIETLGYGDLGRLPATPSAEIDAWLWDLIVNPVDYNIEPEWIIHAAWAALAKRDTSDLLPYLRQVALGHIVPEFAVSEFGIFVSYDQLRESAKRTVESIEEERLSREQRLVRQVNQIAQGDTTLIGTLMHQVQSTDQYLIPLLTRWRPENWIASNYRPPIWPAVHIMQKVPDEKFLPLLRAWSDELPVRAVLEAMVACGDQSLAIEKAVAALAAEPPKHDRYDFFKAVHEKGELLLFLGEFGDPNIGEHILPFIEQRTIQQLEEAEIAIGRQLAPRHAWSLRDAALLGLVKSGHPEAIPRLKTAYDRDDIRVKVICALALLTLGDTTGIDLIDAYRNRGDESIAKLEVRRSLELHGSISRAIRYLDNPALDGAVLDRLTIGFERADSGVVTDPEFVERYESIVLEAIITHIDDPDPEKRDLVVDCLERITNHHFKHKRSDPYLLQRPAIEKWKKYVAQRIEGLR